MKFRLFVFLAEKFLGVTMKDNKREEDMYLPLWLLAFGMCSVSVGVAMAVMYLFLNELILIFTAPFLIVLGILAVVCWKNQTIVIISNDKFEYTTFLGNKHTYYFKDITDLRQNSDSITMFVGKNKVHIESIAVMSPKLESLINKALEERYL